MEPIYHLALAANWAAALESGSYEISSIDRTLAEEGFIHASFASQLQATADRFYRGRDDVVLLEIDPELVEVEIRVEGASAGGRGFPHLYGALDPSWVVAVRPLPVGEDGRLDTGAVIPRR